MISSAYINDCLTRITDLSLTDREELNVVIQKFPYCNLLQHLSKYNNKNSTTILQELYPANPVLLAMWDDITVLEKTKLEEAEEGIEKSVVEDELIIEPISAEDYFLQQGVAVSQELPELEEFVPTKNTDIVVDEDSQSLLVMMSFSEWLHYLNHKAQKAKEEEEEQKALKAQWRKQKLAAAIEEENEDIPDQVYEMAVNSIAPQENVASEALALVYAQQGKREKAIDMYRKLSLLNPEKSVYFAHKIELLQKEI